jgi:large conductance mechanosensitive channel
MKKFLQEFRDFIATGNLVEVAVAFILGLAIKAVIDAFINHVANPIIGAIFGKPNLDHVLEFTLRKGKGEIDPTTGKRVDASVLSIGAVLTQIVSLILVGLVLFLAIKAYNKIRKPEPVATETGPSEIDLLTDIRDALRNR